MTSHDVPTVGLGLRSQHYSDAAECAASGLWFEVHSENYMIDGGPRLAWLETIRARHPLSLHGVGLSLATDAEPDREHLARLRRLVDRFEPFVVSEHLAWSSWNGVYHPDLLPIPRSHEALVRVADNIQRMQDAIKRTILIENPSHYLELPGHEYGEIDFLTDLCSRTDCKLLLDVNNVFVSANNLGFDAARLCRCDTKPLHRRSASGRAHTRPIAGQPIADRFSRRTHRTGCMATVRATHRESRPATDTDRTRRSNTRIPRAARRARHRQPIPSGAVEMPMTQRYWSFSAPLRRRYRSRNWMVRRLPR